MYRLKVNDIFIDGYLSLALATDCILENKSDRYTTYTMHRDGFAVFKWVPCEAPTCWVVTHDPQIKQIDWIVYFIDGMKLTQAATAKRMGVSPANISQQYKRYKNKIKELNLRVDKSINPC